MAKVKKSKDERKQRKKAKKKKHEEMNDSKEKLPEVDVNKSNDDHKQRKKAKKKKHEEINDSKKKVPEVDGDTEANNESCTLFVGCLSETTTDASLLAAFAGATCARVVPDTATGMCSGFGLVEYSTPQAVRAVVDEAVTKPVQVDGQNVTLFVGNPLEKTTKTKLHALHEAQTKIVSHQLFVRNLRGRTTNEALQKAFPTALRATVIHDKNTGKQCGVGVVTFDTIAAAQLAYNNSQMLVIDGKVVLVVGDLKDSVKPNLVIESPVLRIHHLRPETTTQELREAFPTAVHAELLRMAESDIQRCGLVAFDGVADAQEAANQSKHLVLGDRLLGIEDASFPANKSLVMNSPKLCLGQLSAKTTHASLQNAFPDAVKVQVFHSRNGRSNMGFVEFKSTEAAQQAANRSAHLCIDHRMVLLHNVTPKRNDDELKNIRREQPSVSLTSPVVFVNHVGPRTTLAAVKDAFTGAEEVHLAVDVHGKHLGYGFVRFHSIPAAQRAIDATELHRIDGRTVEVCASISSIAQSKSNNSVSAAGQGSSCGVVSSGKVSAVPSQCNNSVCTGDNSDSCAVVLSSDESDSESSDIEVSSQEKQSADIKVSASKPAQVSKMHASDAASTEHINVQQQVYNPTVLHVLGLQAGATEAALKEAFPTAATARLLFSRKTGKSLGVVTFRSEAHLERQLFTSKELEISGYAVTLERVAISGARTVDTSGEKGAVQQQNAASQESATSGSVDVITARPSAASKDAACSSTAVPTCSAAADMTAVGTTAESCEADVSSDEEDVVMITDEDSDSVQVMQSNADQSVADGSSAGDSSADDSSADDSSADDSSADDSSADDSSADDSSADDSSADDSNAQYSSDDDAPESLPISRSADSSLSNPSAQTPDVEEDAQLWPMFVGNLNRKKTTEETLKAAFPMAVSVSVSCKKGKSRGCGFVNFASEAELRKTLDSSKGLEIDGNVVEVALATHAVPPHVTAQSSDCTHVKQTNSNKNRLSASGNTSVADMDNQDIPNTQAKSKKRKREVEERTSISNCDTSSDGDTPVAKKKRRKKARENKTAGTLKNADCSVNERCDDDDDDNGDDKLRVDSSDDDSLTTGPVYLAPKVLQSKRTKLAKTEKAAPKTPKVNAGFVSRLTPRLFVGNLHDDVTSEMLAEKFPDATSVKVVRDKKTNASKHCGFVEYPTNKAAKAAAKRYRKLKILKRQVNIKVEGAQKDKIKSPKKGSGKTTRVPTTTNVVVRNLASSTTEDQLKEAFPGVHNVHMPRYEATALQEAGVHKGFAHLTFSSAEEAKAAVDSKDGTRLDGRVVFVSYATKNWGIIR